MKGWFAVAVRLQPSPNNRSTCRCYPPGMNQDDRDFNLFELTEGGVLVKDEDLLKLVTEMLEEAAGEMGSEIDREKPV